MNSSADVVKTSAKIAVRLSREGLLLTQDKHALNVVSLVTGDTLRGSWWSHPQSHLIFEVLSRLSEHPDVLFSKLIDGKVTLVHRDLWPAFLAVASEGAAWQMTGLTVAARRLLAAANRSPRPVACSGPPVKELETRLLVHSREMHTPTGRHETVVEPWPVWARNAGVRRSRSTAGAKQRLEEAAQAIGAKPSSLPWN